MERLQNIIKTLGDCRDLANGKGDKLDMLCSLLSDYPMDEADSSLTYTINSGNFTLIVSLNNYSEHLGLLGVTDVTFELEYIVDGNLAWTDDYNKIENYFCGETKIINLTPHEVNIIGDDSEIIRSFPSEGSVRISSESKVINTINGIPFTEVVYGDAIGLPEEEANTFYIVSIIVKNALPNRKDLISPNTNPGQVVRYENGQIMGVKSFM